MSAREALFAAILAAALASVVYGVSMWSVPGAWVLGGVGLAGMGYLFLTEVAD